MNLSQKIKLSFLVTSLCKQWLCTQSCSKKEKQEAQLSLGQPTILVVSDLQGHARSIIFMSFESQYVTSYQ